MDLPDSYRDTSKSKKGTQQKVEKHSMGPPLLPIHFFDKSLVCSEFIIPALGGTGPGRRLEQRLRREQGFNLQIARIGQAYY